MRRDPGLSIAELRGAGVIRDEALTLFDNYEYSVLGSRSYYLQATLVIASSVGRPRCT